MSPDPYKGNSGAAGDVGNPQSWNRYAYVLSDPINYYDPDGLFVRPPPAPVDSSYFWDSYPGPIHGSDKGDVPSHAETLQDAWDSLSDDCQKGLKTAPATRGGISGMVAAVNRAFKQIGMLMTAAQAHGIDYALLGAIALRETGFQNVPQSGGGDGRGIFQIDIGKNPNVT